MLQANLVELNEKLAAMEKKIDLERAIAGASARPGDERNRLIFLDEVEDRTLDLKKLRHLMTCRNWEEFDSIVSVTQQMYEAWPELRRKQPDLPEIPTGSKTFTQRQIVALVLMRLRRNFRFTTLAFMYDVARSTISTLIHSWLPIVAEGVHARYVVLSRQALRDHTPLRFELNVPNIAGLCDCTYIYINKSASMNFQKRSYSEKKGRNLLKVLLMSYPDGTIAGIWGPFDDESDTTIMRRILTEATNFSEYFRRGDTFLFDRGFKGREMDNVRLYWFVLLHFPYL
mmetsp:Transcript_25762/g.64693  ORF Transcript_25762/g.64693 Transcript_25762/m.64693 type:complete len:286 (-) Transcript_25762:908-1765(-)